MYSHSVITCMHASCRRAPYIPAISHMDVHARMCFIYSTPLIPENQSPASLKQLSCHFINGGMLASVLGLNGVV